MLCIDVITRLIFRRNSAAFRSCFGWTTSSHFGTMTDLKLVALVLLGLLALSQCAPSPVKPNRRNMLRGRPVGGLLKKPVVRPNANLGGKAAVQGMFTNLVDHFSDNKATYQQRYWYNDQYFKRGGPVFLMLGGESAEDPYWLEDSQLAWAKMAADNGAYMFLIEHRYYGMSRPTPDMSSDNLVYLSSAQALEDMATFINGMKQQFPQLAGSKWVTFGGSYSGALAAWAREKHPELITLAVGSSGPVQAEVDFTEYMEVVQASINSTTRGSAKCAASVGNAMNQVTQLLGTASGRQSLKNTFNLCSDIDPSKDLDLKTFWETVYSPYMEIVQYSNDNAGEFNTLLTIKNAICKYHEDDSLSALQKLQKVNTYFDTMNFFFGCNDISYQNSIDWIKETSFDSEAADARAWVWQTCTEFGYYQSTDSPTAGPFFGGVGTIPASYYVDQCLDIYGSTYNSDSVSAAVDNTNQYYGGRDNMATDHVILPNGNIDPWHALGKLDNSVDTLVPVIIDGSAHCSDMYTPSPNDLPALTNARTQIAQQLADWLNQVN